MPSFCKPIQGNVKATITSQINSKDITKTNTGKASIKTDAFVNNELQARPGTKKSLKSISKSLTIMKLQAVLHLHKAGRWQGFL